MNILYLPGYRYPASLQEPLTCGDLRYSFNLSQGLARKGVSVTVLSRKRNGDPLEDILNGVRILRYQSELPVIFSTSFDISPSRAKLFRSLLKHVNLVICNSPLSLELCHKLTVPLVYICSGLEDIKNYSHSIKEILSLWGIKILRDPYKKFTWEKAAYVNTTAEQEDHTLERLGVPNNKIRTIGPSVDTSRYYPQPDHSKHKLRTSLGLDFEEKLIISVSRFTPAKGLLETLRGFASLCKQRNDVRLLIMGVHHSHADTYFQSVLNEIKQLSIEDHVIIRENIPEEQLPLYYSLARVSSVFSVKYDPLPTVLIESMACGVPVVSTHYPTRTQIITDQVDGVFVQEGRIDQWVSSVQRILDDHDWHRKLQLAGLEKVKAKFDVNRIVDQYMELFQTL